MDVENLSDFFEDDIFSVLEAWENASSNNKNNKNVFSDELSFEFHKSSSDQTATTPPSSKRQKVADSRVEAAEESGQPRTSHIKVERNRRKQMNENLSVLRSLMPCFYVKRGDQASVIGGVVDYITELQHLIQSLQAQKQRKSGPDIMSPRPSPRKPPLSPRLSPRTPQSVSPYKHILQPSVESIISPCSSSVNDAINELVASMKSEVAEVEVKFTGPNLVLKTVSRRGAGPGQAVRIVSALEELDLEILHVKINVVDERVLNLFTIKIGIECGVSAQELAQQIHHTFGLPNTHPEFGNANLTSFSSYQTRCYHKDLFSVVY